MDETSIENQLGQDRLAEWQKAINTNVYSNDKDLMHTVQFWFGDQFNQVNDDFKRFGELIATQLEPLVAENHFVNNLPRIEHYNGIGERIERIIHHPSYYRVGDIIYGSQLLSHFANPKKLLHCLSLFFLSSEAGEAGHNCPIA